MGGTTPSTKEPAFWDGNINFADAERPSFAVESAECIPKGVSRKLGCGRSALGCFQWALSCCLHVRLIG